MHYFDNMFSEANYNESIILLLLIGAFVVQLGYYLGIFSQLFRVKNAPVTRTDVKPCSVSVIVCVRNGADLLMKHLPALLNQSKQGYQLVIVNDASNDETLAVAKAFAEKDQRIKLVDIPADERFYGSKKMALTMGIKAADNEYVLLTDVDCIPNSENWIEQMMPVVDAESIVLGFGAYKKQRGFLNVLVRYEAIHTALQYFSFALAGMPYMGVGRNLGYRRELFFASKGFASHQHVISGDDDLFVNETANKKNTGIRMYKDSHTVSLPKETFSSWWRQKTRHFSTGFYYSFKTKIVLGLFHFSTLLFYSCILSTFVNNFFGEISFFIFITRYIVQMIIYTKLTSILGNKDLLFWIPFVEIIYLVVSSIMVLNNLIIKNTRWN